jgi:signal transduction histidine kinase
VPARFGHADREAVVTDIAWTMPAAGSTRFEWPEAERVNLARELHDFVSYTIAAINLQAGVGLHVLADGPERAAESLHAIKATSKDALQELRVILDRLLDTDRDGDQANAPLTSRLERLVETTTGAGIPTRFRISGSPRPLSPALSQTLYRVVQESLTNVLRHSGATCAEISLVYDEPELIVEIVDDGVGETDGSDSPGLGLGVAGMRERVERLGGRLEAGPREVLGFRVRARLAEPSRT